MNQVFLERVTRMLIEAIHNVVLHTKYAKLATKLLTKVLIQIVEGAGVNAS